MFFIGCEGLIDDESCPREGNVGATRQGQHRLWSGKELLQIITPHGMDGSPLRGDYDANEMWEARAD